MLEALQLTPGDALFLDFDGTLVDLGPDPDAIWLPGGMAEVLTDVAAALDGALAVISGRDLADLARRVPSDLWRIGGHGLAVAAPRAPLPEALPPPGAEVLAPLERAAARPGVRLELKGPVAALHYRAAPEAEAACLSAAREAAGEALIVQHGKCVVEVKPAEANKGRALAAALAHPPFAGRRPIMVGDDTTDEDAMAAAQSFGGLGVKVGEGASAANHYTPDPAALSAWLRTMQQVLSG